MQTYVRTVIGLSNLHQASAWQRGLVWSHWYENDCFILLQIKRIFTIRLCFNSDWVIWRAFKSHQFGLGCSNPGVISFVGWVCCWFSPLACSETFFFWHSEFSYPKKISTVFKFLSLWYRIGYMNNHSVDEPPLNLHYLLFLFKS